MLLVEIAVSNAKFHSSQNRTNQSTATNVFQTINHKTEVALAEDLAEEVALAEDLAEEVALAAEVDLTEGLEKCTKRHVETAARIAKYHSSQNRTNQSTATNVFQTINQQEIKKSLYCNCKFY
jgi:hypothetical protein